MKEIELNNISKLRRKGNSLFSSNWIWKLAWKDALHNRNRLFLFITSIIIGIAALVAINSFNFSLQKSIDKNARELLGADVSISTRNQKFDKEFSNILDTLEYSAPYKKNGYKFAHITSLPSMVYFPKNKGTRLVEVKAMDGRYPFYGKIELAPDSREAGFYANDSALIDQSLAIQYGVGVGDSLRLGNLTIGICGIVTGFPGTSTISTTMAPAVYIPMNKLANTGLIQYGSLVDYQVFLKVPADSLKSIENSIVPEARKLHYRVETIASRKEQLGRGFSNLYRFFNLLSFIALILGSIGVSSSVFIYLKEKRESAAVLRCLGASGWQLFYIYFIQINILGLIGTVIGVGLGLLVQLILPYIVSDFLPVSVAFQISFYAMAVGFLVGLLMSVLFAALPLSDIRLVSPMEIFRSTVEPLKKFSRFRYLILFLIVIFPWIFAVQQTESWIYGTAFALALILIFVCLWLVGRFILWFSLKIIPRQAGFALHQGLTNLFRPGNQTIILIIVIGLGTFILVTMNLIQHSLLGQVEFAGSGIRPNTVLFDIQPGQKDEVVKYTESHNIEVQQLVPIVTMRLASLKGKTIEEWRKDSTSGISRWALGHEYRVTYRDSLIPSETLQQGRLHPYLHEGDSVFVSVSDNLARNLKLNLGDSLTFNVQGVPMKVYVGSIRKVDWQRIQTNFMVVFPKGVLDEAPQFFVLITRINDKTKSADFQRALVQKFPNISVIDLTLILQTLDQIFDKVQMVIRFMALFSVLTGLFVLSGAVANSKYARLRENVLLRTIGALRKQINGMTFIEYFMLGIFSVIAGSLLSIVSSWGLAKYFFEIKFSISWPAVLLISAIVATLTVFVGWVNSRSILNRSPLEVLRKEV